MKKIKILIALMVIVCVGGIIFTQVGTKKIKPHERGVRKDGTEFKIFKVPPPEPRKVRELVPIKVERFEVQVLAEGTDAGSPGDFLLTFKGQGFILSSLAPRVILQKRFALEKTEINESGTELYVIISKEILKSKISRMDFKEVIIENPGGLIKEEFARTRVKMTPKDLLYVDPKAKKVRLVYKDNFFERQDVDDRKEEK